MPPGVPGDIEHQDHRHQHAGDQPAGEKLADRDVADDAENDHGQRWRNDRADGRGRRGDADRELVLVAMVAHGLDLDGTEAAGIGDRGSRHAGEDDRADHVHMAEAALHPAHRRDCEVVDAVGNPGRVHQVAGQDEERHGEQGKRIDAAGHPVEHHEVRDHGLELDVGERPRGKRHEDRNPEHEQEEEDAEQPDHAALSVDDEALAGRVGTPAAAGIG
jgi:hypothetical protein